ncbi:MAG: hypothetical protein N3A58_06950 [Spirochaetes bacterium]|nr:hypothetical protein [Spirochaetota bacterium]
MNYSFTRGILLYTNNFDIDRKLIHVLNENSSFESFFVDRKYINSIDKICIINYVIKSYKKSYRIIYLEKIEEFKSISLELKKVLVVHLFFELFRKFVLEKGILVEFKIYDFLYYYLYLLEELNFENNRNFLNNIFYILTVFLIIEGFLNFEYNCSFCRKNLYDGLYFDIKNYFVRCKEHRTVYSYFIPIKILNYIDNLYSFFLKKDNKKNFFILLENTHEKNKQTIDLLKYSLPTFNEEELKKTIMFYLRYIYNIIEGRKINTLKFVNYFLKNNM